MPRVTEKLIKEAGITGTLVGKTLPRVLSALVGGGIGAANSGDPLMGGLAGAAIGGLAGPALAKGIAKGVYKGTGKVLNAAYTHGAEPLLSWGLRKHPIEFPVQALTAAAALPITYDMTRHKNYFTKLDQPTAYRGRGEFGRSYFDPYTLQKMSEERTPMKSITNILVKEANIFNVLKDVVTGEGPYTSIKDTINKEMNPEAAKKAVKTLKQMRIRNYAGIGGLTAGGLLMAPTMKSIGEAFRNKILPNNMMVNSELEQEKIRAQGLGEFHTKQEVKKLEKSLKEREDLPQVHDIFSQLKKEDPIISEASKDKRLSHVMDQTINTVFSFAPSLAKDPRALQSVLTEAVSSPSGGLSFQTIKGLADAQKAIAQSKPSK